MEEENEDLQEQAMRRDPQFDALLQKFLDEEHTAPDVFILWTSPDRSVHQIAVRGDILGIAGRLDYVKHAWHSNLLMNSMRSRQQRIITPGR